MVTIREHTTQQYYSTPFFFLQFSLFLSKSNYTRLGFNEKISISSFFHDNCFYSKYLQTNFCKLYKKLFSIQQN